MPKEWKISYEHPVDAKTTLEVGDTFSLQGERGSRYKFIRSIETEAGEVWVDCFGGTSGYGQARSVFPDRIVRVKKKPSGS